MKFGVLQFFGWADRRIPLGQVYERATERYEIMEDTGYDAVWLAEHHFSGYSVCPSVHMMATLAAAKTERLRIGTAVSLAAFYHPLRLAEEIALLDHISGGRVNWGAGRGFARGEFEAFGIPVEESAARFRETVDVVLNAWTNERVSHHGEFFNFEGVEVLPKPLQAPHPPTWMAASSESAIEWAGGRGFSILMDPHCSHAELATKRKLYGDVMAANGHQAAERDIPMARLIAVGNSAEQAAEIARRGAEWTVGSYMQGRGEDPVKRYVDEVIIHGEPEAVVDKLQELKETAQMNYLLVSPLSQATFNLVTDKVLPKLM
ncbi:MAG TPA: LLM class flavin-dependent oxidoreductase [Caulobacteraceae bacterium]|jgi:alkanesulfonate monooxygenase SsuD/methylene tetrahydromethanopterin reductase-like flavin-dependent oxidoreductase (luciferase family)